MSTNKFEVIHSGGGLKVERCKKLLFDGFSRNTESFCYMVLVQRKDEKFVVVCSQPDNYVGTSVTNAVEIIYSQLLKIRGKKLRVAHWLEHYPPGAGMLQERYTLMEVVFNDGSPSWGPVVSWSTAAKRVDVPVKFLAYGFEKEID
jgi:hypothetical protein